MSRGFLLVGEKFKPASSVKIGGSGPLGPMLIQRGKSSAL